MPGNYNDPAATRSVDLGPCRCPVDPKPHVNDSADVVVRFGFGPLGRIRQASRTFGAEEGYQVAILLGAKRWTLVLPDGSARPIDAEQVAMLDEATVTGVEGPDGEVVQHGLMFYLAEAIEPEDPLPNAPGAPSPDGRPESASPTQTIQAPQTSTST